MDAYKFSHDSTRFHRLHGSELRFVVGPSAAEVLALKKPLLDPDGWMAGWAEPAG